MVSALRFPIIMGHGRSVWNRFLPIIALLFTTYALQAQDLSLDITSTSPAMATIGGTVTHTVVVTNTGSTAMTNVQISNTFSPAIGSTTTLSGTPTATLGTYSSGTWTIPSLSGNTSATLTIVVVPSDGGIYYITSEIMAATGGIDPDSTPGNAIAGEDDMDRDCFTVSMRICPGETYTVTVPNTYTNVLWYKDAGALAVASGNTINITAAGSYTFAGKITVDGNQCDVTSCCPVMVQVLTPTPAILSSNSPVCVGQTLNLTASGGASYSWAGPGGFSSILATPSRASVTTAMSGIYSVTTTGTGTNTCTASSTTSVSVQTYTIAATATPTSVCPGGSTSLSVTTGDTYLWAQPASSGTFSSTSTQTPTVSGIPVGGPYNYSVTVTSGACTASAVAQVTLNAVPTLIATGNNPCVNDAILLTASGANTYSWSGPNGFGSSTQNPQHVNASVSMSGVYTVTGISAGGCSATATVSVSVSPLPTLQATGAVVCVGQTATLNAASNTTGTYQWLGPSFGSTAQNPSIANANTTNQGIYSVTMTATNGCTATTTASVAVGQAGVVATALPVCDGGTLVLQATVGGASYTWAGPNGFTSGYNAPTITNATSAQYAGVYTVTVNGSAGNTCTGTASVNVTFYANPNLTASVTTPICEKGTLQLTSSAGFASYSWLGPNAFGSNVQNPSLSNVSLNGAGIYSVTVTDNNGCKGSATASLVVNPLPTTTASVTSPVCIGQSATLYSSFGVGYTWSWAGPVGSAYTSASQNPTIASVTAANAGVYTVTVSLNACTATATTQLVVNANPTATASGNTPICAGGQLNLQATGGGTYQWSGPNNFGSQAANPSQVINTVAGAGVYTVQVNVNGCTATATTSVVINPVPVPNVAGDVVCVNQTATLTASGGTAYAWQGPGGYTGATQNPSITNAQTNQAGIYTVTVTQTGCTATGTASLVVNQLGTITATANTPLCIGNTLLLDVTAGAASYVWAGPAGFTSNSQSPTRATLTTAMAGVYSVTASGGTGCTGTGTVSVVVNQATPPTAGSNSPICAGLSLNLTSSGGYTTYAWNGPNSFGSSVQNPTQTNATTAMSGNYTVVVTDANNCTASAVTAVTVNPNPTLVSITSSGLICENTTLNLGTTASSSSATAFTYSWAGPNAFTSASQSPVISNATTAATGTYSVTITQNSCTVTGTTTASVYHLPITANTIDVCETKTAQLNAVSTGINSYQWSGPAFTGGLVSALQNPTITNTTTAMTGVYTVLVTNGATNCTSTATTSLSIKVNPIPTIVTDAPICEGLPLNVTANITSPTAGLGFNYQWVATGGTFSSAIASPTILNSLLAGPYTISLTVTNNGCTATATQSVSVKALPTVTVAIPQPICEGQTVNLSPTVSAPYAGLPISYNWASSGSAFTGANTANPTVGATTTPGGYSYTVTVTNNACTATATTSLSVKANPTVTSSPNTPICFGVATNLTATYSPLVGTTIAWSASSASVVFSNTTTANPTVGATTPVGSYSFTVTVTNTGCTATATTSLLIKPTPVPVATGQSICQGSNLALSVSSVGSNAGYTYNWSGPSGFSNTQQNPTINNATTAMSGIYSVTVTSDLGCTATTTAQANVYATPVVQAFSGIACLGYDLPLAATGANLYKWSGPLGFTSILQNPTVTANTVGVAGIYSVTGTATYAVVGGPTLSCTNTATTIGNVAQSGASATAPSPICEGQTLTLNSTPGTSYSWAGPSSFSSTLQNPTRPNATTAMAGIYSVTAVGAGACTGTATVSVSVNPKPIVTLSSNASPTAVCVGQAINFTATSSAPGKSCIWGGPNNFTSTEKAPTIASATTAANGVYTVTISDSNNCSNTATTSVTVSNCCSITVSVNANAVCVGGTLQVSASGVGIASYSWSGPNNFTSTLQSPAMSNATTAMAGVYSVTVQGTAGVTCTMSATVSATVNAVSVTASAASTTVLTGGTLSLSASSPTATSYLWSGPSAFSSTLQNPTRTPATTAMSGIYTVTASNSTNCTNTATVSIIICDVVVSPQVNAACVGNTIQLSANGQAVASYTWSGPAGFSSTLQNPTRTNADNTMAGVYSVTVVGTANPTCTASATVNVILNQKPTIVLASASAIVASGGTIQLSASGGSSYAWSGPSAFSSTLQNPTRTVATSAMSGIYTVTVSTTESCTNTATISINVSPCTLSLAAEPKAVCVGATLQLSASGTNIASYNWSGPDTFSSTLQAPTRASVTSVMSGIYSVSVVGTEGTICTASTTVSVTINEMPTPTVTANSVAVGETLQLSATGGGTYMWSGPAGFSSTLQNPTRPSATTAMSGTYTVTVSSTAGCTATATTTVNVTLVLYGSIGDYVWKDYNKNGLQDDGATGVKDVTIELYKTDAQGFTIGAPIKTKKTDINGFYKFDSLLNGFYKVKFITTSFPADCQLTTANQGTDDAKDSDADPTSGFSPMVTIDVNAGGILRDNPTIDAGLVAPYGSIGDYVWKDTNANGIQDVGEKGVSNVTVELYKTDALGTTLGAAIKTKVTDATGKYLFDSLRSGDYKVKFVLSSLPADCRTLTTVDKGTDDAKDSDADLNGFSPKITINANGTGLAKDNPTIDLGVIPAYGSLGDYTWLDVNKDGVQDPTESPLAQVWVYLYDGVTGVKLDSMKTDPQGKYTFDSLPSGKYRVKFVAPQDTELTKGNVGDDKKDSDAGADGFSHLVTIDASKATTDTLRNNPQIDAGFVIAYGSIGDFVWKDRNANGIQDTGEPGVPNIKVELLNGITNAVIETKTTDALGAYKFDNLLSGKYKVRFSNIPADCKITDPNKGTDDTKDSDVDKTTGTSHIVTIDTRKLPTDTLRNNPNIDAGLVPNYASLGDYVWKDANKNGIQDATEVGVKGVTVELYKLDALGNTPATPIKSKLTDATGKYYFDSLTAGDYKVKFVAASFPADCDLTTPDKGTDDSKDSDAGTDGFSPKVTLDPSSTGLTKDNPTIDAGLIPSYGSIGDFVWKDENKNGIQDPTEKGVANISVELYKTDANGTPQGAAIKTKLTDATGKYLFDSLASGNYKVKFIPTSFPADCSLTTPNAGTDDAKDSDITLDGFSPVIPINAKGTGLAKDNPTIDAGLVPAFGSIGDYVWKDTNKNGLQDATEIGVKGVTVELYKTDVNGNVTGGAIKTKVTDATGKYSFDSLASGNYKVRFVTSSFPTDCSLTTPNAGTDDAKDSDASPDGFSPMIPIDAKGSGIAKDNPTVDAGLVPAYGSIGDFVWKDTNKNGLQDAGELGVKAVTVELYKTDANGTVTGVAIKTKVTDINGKYLFDSLPSGSYKVRFVTSSFPADCELTTPDKGTDDTKDSDVGTDGYSPKITIDATGTGLAKDNPTVDAGLIPAFGSIGDYVWKDRNANGVQDTDETGVKGITVELYKTDVNGNVTGFAIKTKVTDATGKYLFDSLPSGNYKVRFVTTSFPADCSLTTADKGTDDAKDSDAGTDGFSPRISIDAKGTGLAKDNPTIDAGLVPSYGSIGDYVWKDRNSNGIQDAEENGVKDITVELYATDANGNVTGGILKTKKTDATGKYLFDSLASGNYKVRFVTTSFPADCSLTTADKGTDDAKDSDAGTDGFSPRITINANGAGIEKSNLTIDAGLVPLYGSIGDYVWKDTNANGIQDLTEVGVKGIKIELYKADVNGNLVGAAIATKTTDATGKYLFDSLAKGDYVVRFVTASFPAECNLTDNDKGGDDTKDSDANPLTGYSPRVTIDPTGTGILKSNLTIDAGLVPNYGSIGDYVWKDANANGIQDVTETGVKDVTVELYKTDANGNVTGSAIKVTKTDANGKYLFDSLLKGDYKVKFVTTSFPADCDLTTPDRGADDAKDSDAGTDGFSPRISIDPSGTGIVKNNLTIDAGLVPAFGSIGDYVWKDENANGIQDATEKGVANITVELYKVDGNGNVIGAVLQTAKTDATGKYLFDSLTTGSYKVRFVTSSFPADCDLTTPNKGTDDAKDSDASSDGFSPVVSINAKGTGLAKDNPTVDAGLVPAFGSIGDYVWKDENANGIQDATEKGVANITVELYKTDANGTVTGSAIKTAKTDATGKYLFDSLASGNYKVKFVTTSFPADCDLTSPDKGGDDTKDSDAGTDGFSPKVTIDARGTGLVKNNPTVDAGLVPAFGSIGDYVWKDANTNGIQDATEKGVANVTVELYKTDANGTVTGSAIKTAKTDATGKYLFDSLASGNYKVKFVTTSFPADCAKLTDPDKGTDDTVDSDANTTDGFSPKVTINAKGTGTAKNNPTIDAGLLPTGSLPPVGSIGDYVWKDINDDGIQNDNEKGTANVTVELYITNANGVVQGSSLKSTKTDANGQYSFTNLSSGFYKVRFVTTSFPANCIIGRLNQGNDDTKDSDSDANGFSHNITIDVNGTGLAKDNPTIDCALIVDPGSNNQACPIDAGPDARLCAPETTTKLKPAAANQKWLSMLKNPKSTTIDQTGLVLGMTKSGIYRFILRGNENGVTCEDTVAVKRGILNIPDTTICGSQTTAKLEIAPSGNTWSILPGNPSAATIDQNGNVTGLTQFATYKFLMQNQTCKDTALVKKVVRPTYTARTEAATCADGVARSDAKIILNVTETGLRFDISKGESYTGGKDFSIATVMPADGVITNTLTNPIGLTQPYTVRVWNEGGCFVDTTVQLTTTKCDCAPAKCVPFAIQRIK
jgi:large repetitive protein